MLPCPRFGPDHDGKQEVAGSWVLGHDTTSSFCSWLHSNLYLHPDSEKRLLQ